MSIEEFLNWCCATNMRAVVSVIVLLSVLSAVHELLIGIVGVLKELARKK